MAQPNKKLQSVPAWEKEFCLKVGLFQWQQFVEAKKYIHQYQNIMVWDDSAGKEAFIIAKERFKARSYGLPCNNLPVPPTPNACIVNRELLFGLEVCLENLVYSNSKNNNKNKNKKKNENGRGGKDGNSSWKICQIKNWIF